MAVDFLANVDLHKNQLLNVVGQLLAADPGSPTEGLFYVNNSAHTVKYYNGTTWISLGRLDQITAPTAQVDLNSQKVVNLATPTAGTDASTKAYVDGVAQGLSWKTSVRAATTANGTLASAFANGQVVDGVTLATNDRILLKNQTTGTENGLYTVNSAGAPTRATDADTGTEMVNAAVMVQEGTTNADSLWVCTTNAPITLGSTSLAFAQVGSGTMPVAGAGLFLTGSTIDAVAGASPSSGGPGGGLVMAADSMAIDTNVVVRKYAVDVGTGAATTITVTHNLGTKDVVVTCFDNTTPFAEVYPEVRHNATNSVDLVFTVAPTSNQYRCVVKG